MKKIILLITFITFSFLSFAQEHKKIELAFMDYTESDSAFYNTNVPTNHYAYDNFDLYFHFEGETEWRKVKRAKDLHKALKENPVSTQQIKRYKRKRLWGTVITIGGLAGGAVLTGTVSVVGGIATIVASSASGLYIISKADKHLFEAIHLYNQSIK